MNKPVSNPMQWPDTPEEFAEREAMFAKADAGMMRIAQIAAEAMADKLEENNEIK